VLIFEVQQNSDVTMVPQRVFGNRHRREDLTESQAKELFLELSTSGDVPLGRGNHTTCYRGGRGQRAALSPG